MIFFSKLNPKNWQEFPVPSDVDSYYVIEAEASEMESKQLQFDENGTPILVDNPPSEAYVYDGKAWVLTAEKRQDQIQVLKKQLLTATANKTDEIKSQLFAGYPQAEIESFYRQEREARAFKEDNSTACEMLSAIAEVRGIPLALLVDKVIDKADQIAKITGGIIGKRQAFETQIENAQTLEDLQTIQAEVEKWSI